MEFNSTYWHERAREMRNFADQTKNPQSKGTMLTIAHDYDLLAYQAKYHEKWAFRRGSDFLDFSNTMVALRTRMGGANCK